MKTVPGGQSLCQIILLLSEWCPVARGHIDAFMVHVAGLCVLSREGILSRECFALSKGQLYCVYESYKWGLCYR